MNKNSLIDTLVDRIGECEETLMTVNANLEDIRGLLRVLKLPTPRTTKKKICELCAGQGGWYAPGLGRGLPERWIPCSGCSRKGKKKGAVRHAVR